MVEAPPENTLASEAGEPSFVVTRPATCAPRLAIRRIPSSACPGPRSTGAERVAMEPSPAQTVYQPGSSGARSKRPSRSVWPPAAVPPWGQGLSRGNQSLPVELPARWVLTYMPAIGSPAESITRPEIRPPGRSFTVIGPAAATRTSTDSVSEPGAQTSTDSAPAGKLTVKPPSAPV